MKRETRKQKIARQQAHAAGRAADRAFDPIRAAIDSGELTITPLGEVDPLSGREYCPRCSSGPRQREDVVECPDCGYTWEGPRLLGH